MQKQLGASACETGVMNGSFLVRDGRVKATVAASSTKRLVVVVDSVTDDGDVVGCGSHV